ncbi:hypothetical protein ACA910_017114 [Epithemia clementina (nom. ined.)]
MLTLLSVVALLKLADAFFPAFQKTAQTATKDFITALEFVSPEMSGVKEAACLDTASRIRLLPVEVPSTISKDGKVGISFSYWAADQKKKSKTFPLPLVLVHGFDSSCLEYRRLGPLLAAEGIDTYAVDLLGWGFTQLNGVETFSAEAKIAALNAFLSEVTNSGKFCIAGASLGGAAAIDVAATNPNCAGLILIDAQGFVDGIGPMSIMPSPVARLGVEVLKSVPLRSSANQMSYFDKVKYATDEAVVIGRLHCLREGWNDALVSFMKSGGFSPSAKLAMIQCPSLVLWGRQDGILDGEEFVPKFISALTDSELQWIEDCGHVPHLEKPGETATAITSFLSRRVLEETGGNKGLNGGGWIGIAGFGAAALAMADQLAFP